MTYENFEDFHPNIQRKVQGSNYDLDKEVRMKPKTELRAAKLEKIRKDLKDQTGRDSNQALLEYVLALGWEKFQELKIEPAEKLEDLSETRD